MTAKMRTDFPFMYPATLLAQNMTIPSKEKTKKALPLLDLSISTPMNEELKGYRYLYGLNHLAYQYYFQGYIDIEEYRIHCQIFQPKLVQYTQIQGTVWLLHGYLEHSGIYQPIIDEILQQGFNVVIFDLPGHGLSNGISAGIKDFSQYQKILEGVKDYLFNILQSEQILVKPWLGIGQSTGAAILLDHISAYAAQRKEPIVERVLVLSPLIRPAKVAWWHNPIGLNIVKRIKKDVPRYFRRNNHNPEFLRFIRLEDPLQPRTMSMQWILAMSCWMNEMEQRPACRIPVWLVQGALDQTVDWKYNIQFIREKFRLQVSMILEEGSHQLVNEREDIRAALTGLIPTFLHTKSKHKTFY